MKPQRKPIKVKSKLLERYAVTDARVYAVSAYRSAEVEAMRAETKVVSQIHGRAYRNRPLTEEQTESNGQNSKIRARIEHVFGFMSQAKKGFYLRYIGRRRNAAAIGLITT